MPKEVIGEKTGLLSREDYVLRHTVSTTGLDRNLRDALLPHTHRSHHTASATTAVQIHDASTYGSIGSDTTRSKEHERDDLSDVSDEEGLHGGGAPGTGSPSASALHVLKAATGSHSPSHKALMGNGERLINPLFTMKGRLNTETTGVNWRQLVSREWYFTLVSQSWPQLFLASLVLYLGAAAVITMMYYFACKWCGAHVTPIIALYFNVVSLAANGGYLGEDPVAVDSSTFCYELRTYIVMFSSYVNIVIVAFIASLFVAKASRVAELRHRILFGDCCLIREVNDALCNKTEDGRPVTTPHRTVVGKGFASLARRLVESRRRRRGRPVATDSSATTVPSNAEDQSYMVQFRLANTNQAWGKCVLDGELKVFLVTQEIVNRKVRSVRVRTYELPWSSLDEIHEDEESIEEFNVSSSCKTLRLWFPTTVSIALSAYSSNRACRLFHQLLQRHSKEYHSSSNNNKNSSGTVEGKGGASVGSAALGIPLNINKIFDFQIMVEYHGQDTASGGSSFVARHVYTPAAFLRGFRFADTAVFLTQDAYERTLAQAGHGRGIGKLSYDRKVFAAQEGDPALEVDFRRFNATEPDE